MPRRYRKRKRSFRKRRARGMQRIRTYRYKSRNIGGDRARAKLFFNLYFKNCYIIMAQTQDIKIDAKIPEGPLAQKWSNYKAHQKLVNPANKRRLDIIVVGTGLAGGSAAASLAEMGFNVLNFCIQDSPRRAH